MLCSKRDGCCVCTCMRLDILEHSLHRVPRARNIPEAEKGQRLPLQSLARTEVRNGNHAIEVSRYGTVQWKSTVGKPHVTCWPDPKAIIPLRPILILLYNR